MMKHAINILLFLIAFSAAQRFLLPGLDTLACIVPFIAFIYFKNKNNNQLANSFLVISLFTSIDNGADLYQETASIIRYPIYLSALSILIFNFIPDVQKLRRIFYIISIPIFLTSINFLSQYHPISFNQLTTDFLTLLLILLVFANQKIDSFKLNLETLFSFFLFFSFFELVNLFTFFKFDGGGYLSFDSTKSLIVFPAIYALVFFKNIFVRILIFSLVTMVLFGYVTRQIILSFALVCSVYLIKTIYFKDVIGKIAYLIIIILAMISFSNLNVFESFELIKLFQTISVELFKDNFYDGIRFLDPARFAEHELFFDRSFIEIFFGKGFGSGIYDYKGYLDFVKYDTFAFTAQELETGYYYNFHDFWIDIPIRFGLVSILILFYIMTFNLIKNPHSETIFFYSLLLFVMLTCQFFSTSGLLLISIFFRNYLDEISLVKERNK